jgi:hypothetical protein
LDSVQFLAFPNVHSNNADLPDGGVFVGTDLENLSTDKLAAMEDRVVIEEILAGVQIALAKVEPFALVKRTAVPIAGGILTVIFLNYVYFFEAPNCGAKKFITGDATFDSCRRTGCIFRRPQARASTHGYLF